MYFTSNSETPHELWINISIYQIRSRCFNRGRYLAGVFYQLMYRCQRLATRVCLLWTDKMDIFSKNICVSRQLNEIERSFKNAINSIKTFT